MKLKNVNKDEDVCHKVKNKWDFLQNSLFQFKIRGKGSCYHNDADWIVLLQVSHTLTG